MTYPKVEVQFVAVWSPLCEGNCPDCDKPARMNLAFGLVLHTELEDDKICPRYEAARALERLFGEARERLESRTVVLEP